MQLFMKLEITKKCEISLIKIITCFLIICCIIQEVVIPRIWLFKNCLIIHEMNYHYVYERKCINVQLSLNQWWNR